MRLNFRCAMTCQSYASLGAFVFESLNQKKLENNVFLVDYKTKQEYTYGTILESSTKLAINLKKLGVCYGDEFGFVAENSWKQIVTVFAGLYLGARLTPLNPDYKIGELLNIFAQSKPKYIFCTERTLNGVQEIQRLYDFPKKIILLNGTITNNNNATDDGLELWDDLLIVRGEEEELQHTFTPVTLEDSKEHVSFILTSSGTTGMPKGVLLKDINFRISINGLTSKSGLDLNERDVVVLYVPMFHIYAVIIYLSCVRSGTKLILLEKFSPHPFLEAIRTYKVTKILAVPTIVNLLAKCELLDQYDLSSVQQIISGAAYLSDDIIKIVQERLNVVIRQLYGMTETGGIVTLSPHKVVSNASIGTILDGAQIKIVPQNNGDNSGIGEICLKGEMIMKGYLNNEAQTKEIIDEDQWLHTGDLGYVDGAGNVYYEGRIKEIIKHKGFQVAPTELEKLLLNHDEIQDAGVIGKPDEIYGELPTAFVVKKENSKITAKEIIEYVAENISRQKHLTGGVYFIDEVPKNSSGKILRRNLQALLSTFTE